MMIISFILAVVPAIIINKIMQRKGLINSDNKKLCRALVIAGMISVFAALGSELLLDEVLCEIYPENTYGYTFFDNFFCTAGSEEGVKFIILMLFAFKSIRINSKFDGAAFGMCVGLGFGVLENIFYSLDGDVTVMILRCIFSVSGHVVYGYIMGEFLQKAKQGKKSFMLFALVIPIIQHGLYDFCLSTEDTMLILLAFVNELFLYKTAKEKIYASLDVFRISIS